MKKVLGKYVELYTVITVVFCTAILILREKVSFHKKVSAVLLFISCVHGWEESKFPGGYFDLLLGKLGLADKLPAELTHPLLGNAPLAAFAVSLLKEEAPFKYAFCFMGLFEMVTHTLGIKLYNNMEKFYVPGIYTGYLWGAVAVWYLLKK